MADIPNDFPWRPGMRGICERASVGFRVVGVAGGALLIVWEDRVAIGRLLGSVATIDPATVEPDLTDPATLGALLGAVREAWRSPSAHTRQRGTIRTNDNRIVPAWEVCDLYLDDEGARAIGASKRGGVQCALLLSEADALLAAWNARPVTR